MSLVLDRTREAGATTVSAETTLSNARAVSLLRSLGWDTEADGDHVRGELRLLR